MMTPEKSTSAAHAIEILDIAEELVSAGELVTSDGTPLEELLYGIIDIERITLDAIQRKREELISTIEQEGQNGK